MSIKDIVKQIERDKRNAEYTNRGIPPIIQAEKAAKI